MTKGWKAYSEKERRKMRRVNHIAKDLRTPKYRMRRIEDNTKKDKYPFNYDDSED